MFINKNKMFKFLMSSSSSSSSSL